MMLERGVEVSHEAIQLPEARDGFFGDGVAPGEPAVSAGRRIELTSDFLTRSVNARTSADSNPIRIKGFIGVVQKLPGDGFRLHGSHIARCAQRHASAESG